jgi:hypothetical protein
MKNSREEKSAIAFVEDAHPQILPHLKEMNIDSFLGGIAWERKRLRPKLTKMFEEVVISLHYENEDEL